MNKLLLLIPVTVLFLTGCSMVGCDRVFPHLTWYWSAEAERCRASHKVGKELAKEWAHTNAVTK